MKGRQISELIELFDEWVSNYETVLGSMKNPIIAVDSAIDGYRELLLEMDVMLMEHKVEATLRSCSASRSELSGKPVVLCITRRNSMMSMLAQLTMSAEAEEDVAQVWEL